MKSATRNWIALLAILLLTLTVAAACGGGDDEGEGTTGSSRLPSKSGGLVKITIGNLSDFTGPTAKADELINMALDDLIGYYNGGNLIPGVELEVLDYDTSYDPAKYIPGYEWLKAKGADLIFTPVPGAPEILRASIEEDGMVMFTPSAGKEELSPPGHIFMPSTIPEDNSYTLLKWVAENDPDFPQDRPAKIGAVAWSTPYNLSLHEAAEEYAKAHPDQYEWLGSYTAPTGTFTWGPEVQALKDCDYVIPPIHMGNFVREYRRAGYDAKLLGTGAQAAFLYLITDAGLWNEIDGMLFFGITAWWNDNTEVAQFMKDRLYENHADVADEIIGDGSAYGAIDAENQMFEIIKNTVEAVGAENFSSEALYEVAQSYQQISDGVVRASFTATKRASLDRLGIYEADAASEDLFMVSDGLIPVVHEP